MRRISVLCMVGALLLMLGGFGLAWGKAHVPIDQVQICRSDGIVRNINAGRLGGEVARGACRLTVCAFNNSVQRIFLPGDACDATDANSDSFCDATGTPADVAADGVSAVDITSACSNPF